MKSFFFQLSQISGQSLCTTTYQNNKTGILRITLWRVHVTILQWKYNTVFYMLLFLLLLLIYMSLSKNDIKCCKTMLSWKIYVTGNNARTIF